MDAILLFGGNSDERLVSVASAQNLAGQYPFSELWFMQLNGTLQRVSVNELRGHERPFEKEFKSKEPLFAQDLVAALPFVGERVVFMGFHGTQGEDGQIQALFEKSRVAFTGSGSCASALAFDKISSKKVAQQAGLRLAAQLVLNNEERQSWPSQLQSFFAVHKKIVAKPSLSGSSFGLHIIDSKEKLQKATSEILSSPYEIYLVEEFIQGRELTVGVLNQDSKILPLPPSEVELVSGGSFDYQGKYLGRGTREITPADLSQEQTERVQTLAIKAHQAFGCEGYSRTDMILTLEGPVFLETNTLPGMTKASFFPQQLEAAGISLKDFLTNQIFMGKQRVR